MGGALIGLHGFLSLLSPLAMNRLVAAIVELPARLLVAAVRLYQWTISPWLGPVCRFEPSCSHYMIGAIEKYGAVRGTLKGLWRILRCNPFCQGGYDPP